MKSQDIYRIECESSGCFHHEHIIISIRKSDTEEFQYKYSDQDEWTDIDDPEDLLTWEKEYNELKRNSGCTTIEIYHIYLNGKLVSHKMDTGCKWSGFLKLKKILPEK